MKISKTTTIGAVISMILLSILFASLLNLISTNTIGDVDEQSFKISNKSDNLIWFLQISDIHISIFQDPSRITEFKEFCDYTINRIKPDVVLASGDLTDAKTKDAVGSQQFEAEWQHYRDILKDYDIVNKTLWLDIRGNHDNFNVISIKSKQNYFTNYSMQGREHPRSYLAQVKKGFNTYSFLGIDACLEPGPRRPFNFVGIIDQPEIDEINRLIEKVKNTGSNYTIWFGHFPTSCILSSGTENVRDLIRKDQNGFVYVCGHLHTLGGLVPRMYTIQNGGYLELELGDWKDNRMYRLMAIDHGMFSFIDIEHRKWPVILVTNPKHALFINPLKENIENIKKSTHVRVLAFSLSNIDKVRIRIDGESWTDLHHVDGPLYVATWDAKRYLYGIHYIEVYVKDVDGREAVEITPFSLEISQMSFGILPRIALMSDLSCIFWSCFIVTSIIYLLPLLSLRYFHLLVSAGYIEQPKLRSSCWKKCIKQIWIFTMVDRIFWPVFLYPLYLLFGPWSIGYIIEDYIGIIFSWGIFVNGAFLPGSFTYAYGFIQLITFQIPLTWILINKINYRLDELSLNSPRKHSLRQQIFHHLPFFFVFVIQVGMAYLFWLAYGTMASVLGPLRTWSLILAGILYYATLRLPENSFRKAKNICFKKSEMNVINRPVTPMETSMEKIEKSN